MADNGATDGSGGLNGGSNDEGERQQLSPSHIREARRRAGPSTTATLRPQRRAAAVAQMKGGLAVAFSCQRCRMSKWVACVLSVHRGLRPQSTLLWARPRSARATVHGYRRGPRIHTLTRPLPFHDETGPGAAAISPVR